MRVLDYEDRFWYLLEDDKNLFLRVNCNHSAFGFSILIELDEIEKSKFKKTGRDCLSNFASDFSFHALTKYKDRDVSKHYKDLTTNAIKKWRDR